MSKGLEALKRLSHYACADEEYSYDDNNNDYKIIEKQLKALDIIKEHWTYNDKGLVQIKPISMENADLLKELLL